MAQPTWAWGESRKAPYSGAITSWQAVPQKALESANLTPLAVAKVRMIPLATVAVPTNISTRLARPVSQRMGGNSLGSVPSFFMRRCLSHTPRGIRNSPSRKTPGRMRMKMMPV